MRTTISILFILLIISTLSCSKSEDDPTQKTIDLSTTISCELVSQANPFSGTVKIKGVIKNTGNSDFLSGTNQQKAYLILKPKGSSPEIILQELDFTSLSKGNELTLSNNRTWSTSTEFPPSFLIRIVYTPDVSSDGNDNNDDVNSSNNSSQLLPSTIDDLF